MPALVGAFEFFLDLENKPIVVIIQLSDHKSHNINTLKQKDDFDISTAMERIEPYVVPPVCGTVKRHSASSCPN